MPVEVRSADGEADAILVYRAFKAMHQEGGIPGPFHDLKVLTNVLRLVNGPGSVVLMAMDGDTLHGVLGLYQQTYWFNEEAFLEDKGFYVLPEHRDGAAFDALLTEAKALSDTTGLSIYITLNNGLRKRGGRSKWERRGMTLGYHPQGAVLAHSPEN